MKFIQEKFRERLYQAIRDDFALERGDIIFTLPPDRRLGDLSTTLPFILAKKAHLNPTSVGERILARIAGQWPECSRVELARGGFLNFFIDRRFLLSHLIAVSAPAAAPPSPSGKAIVEHTSINPNKAAHIGHLRNACLGDMLARALSFLGQTVEVQNYIDDTGIQMADVVWGLLHHRRLDLAAIREMPHVAATLWDLYAEVNTLFAGDPALEEARTRVHQRIEAKQEPEYSVSRFLSLAVLRDHLDLMAELDIRYDLLVRESDIIELDFFKQAEALLKERGILYPSADPEKSGCWVIRYRREDIEKIIVRSNGTITYVGKDIAYQLWKFDLLGRDFRYTPFYTYGEGKTIFLSETTTGETLPGRFGRAERVFNVIDVRQSYLQNLIGQVLADLGHSLQSRSYVHFAYEMVALTPRCVRELGLRVTPEEETKVYLEVSGRKGRAVKADDLLAMLIDKSRQEVAARHPELEAEALAAIARAIAVGALRYFMIKFNLNSVIAFDFHDALNFEGDTGPYLQYTLVRLNSILRKLGSDLGPLPAPADLDPSALEATELENFWDILLNLSGLELQVELAVSGSDPAALASTAYSLCQKFNHYYHRYPVIAEKNAARQNLRLALIRIFKERMGILLHIMGIPIPERM